MGLFIPQVIHPPNPQVGSALPFRGPVPSTRPVGAPVTAQPAPVAGSTGEGLTLDALMARQKAAAARQSETMQQPVTNIPQGLGQLGWTLVNALQERRAEKGIAEGDAAIAAAFKMMDPATGQLPPEAMQVLMQHDPRGLGIEMYKTAMAARAAAANEDQWTQIPTPEGESGQWYQNQNGETKKVGGGEGGTGWKPTDIGSLRDDYTKAALIYDNAAPSWQSMQEAAGQAIGKSGPEVGAADYNMIVGLAKILDPNSVVREGETETVRATGGAADYLISYINQLQQAGSLSDDVRRGIMKTGQSRMQAYYDQAAKKREWISGIATRHQVNPDDVVPPLDPFQTWEEAKPPEDPNAPVIDSDQPATQPEGTKGTDEEGNSWIVKGGKWVQVPKVQ